MDVFGIPYKEVFALPLDQAKYALLGIRTKHGYMHQYQRLSERAK